MERLIRKENGHEKMDKNHSFIFIPKHHFISTLFSVFEVKIRKCKDFRRAGLRGKGKRGKNGKNQQASVYGCLRGIYVRTLFEKGGLIVLSAHR